MIRSAPPTGATAPDASVDLVLALVEGRNRLPAPAGGGGAGAVDWDRFVTLLEGHGLQGSAIRN